jgi:hypothetical protein
MADAANRSRLENMVLLLRCCAPEIRQFGFVEAWPVLVARYPDAREQFQLLINSAADQYCLAFDIFPLNSSLLF